MEIYKGRYAIEKERTHRQFVVGVIALIVLFALVSLK